MAPKHSAEVLAVSCPREKTYELQKLNKLHSGVSYSAVSGELNVNRSTIYVKVSLETHREQGSMLIS